MAMMLMKMGQQTGNHHFLKLLKRFGLEHGRRNDCGQISKMAKKDVQTFKQIIKFYFIFTI